MILIISEYLQVLSINYNPSCVETLLYHCALSLSLSSEKLDSTMTGTAKMIGFDFIRFNFDVKLVIYLCCRR